MYFTAPFQFSAASYRLMSTMVEQQMRVMKVLGDAALTSNPFLTAPVSRRDYVEAAAAKSKPALKAVKSQAETQPVEPVAVKKAPVKATAKATAKAPVKAATVKSTTTPKSAPAKRTRQPSSPQEFAPASMTRPATTVAAHPAEYSRGALPVDIA